MMLFVFVVSLVFIEILISFCKATWQNNPSSVSFNSSENMLSENVENTNMAHGGQS